MQKHLRAILYAHANLTATQYSKVKRGCYLQVNIIFLVFYSNTCYLIFRIEAFGTYLNSNSFSENLDFYLKNQTVNKFYRVFLCGVYFTDINLSQDYISKTNLNKNSFLAL